MNTELQGIYATLKKLETAGASEDAKRTQAMTSALNAISAALTDLVTVAEGRSYVGDTGDGLSAAELIASAISQLRIEAPEVRFEPTINVESPTINVPEQRVSLTVQAGPNNVEVPAAQVTVMPAPEWKKMKVDFDYRNGSIVGAIITRE